MLTVACVLKSGGIYDATWVHRLRNGVAKHLPAEHRFLCLSDVEVPCERIPLKHGWPGWWSKIELFHQLQGPLLYFDLDTVIVGDLSEIADYAQRCGFAMLRDFYAPDHCGSGVMAWGNEQPWQVYREFWKAPVRTMNVKRSRMGDQAFIEEIYGLDSIDRLQDKLPDQIVSYKAHNCINSAPAGARVVCFHGSPKQIDLPGSWVHEQWCAVA